MLLYTATVSLVVVVAVVAQGPPGVPPRTAGGQPNQQQFQQPPPQQQQQQQFQQQPPQQQQQYQQQQGGHQQQGGQQQGGHHGHQGHGDGKQLKFASEIHNADHIMDHLQHTIKTKPKDQMTEEELEFHYFKLHDYDNNNKLDGVEIGKALTHFHDEEQKEPAPPGQPEPEKPPAKVFTDDEISNIVDTVIGDNDENGDGYIEYFEFKRKQEQQREQYRQEQPGHH